MSDVYSVSFDSSWEKQTSQKRERDGGSHLHIICPDKSLRHPRCRDKKLFSARAAPYVHVRGYILIHIPDIQNTSLRIHQQMLIGYSICWWYMHIYVVPTQFHNHFAISPPLKNMVESLLLIQSWATIFSTSLLLPSFVITRVSTSLSVWPPYTFPNDGWTFTDRRRMTLMGIFQTYLYSLAWEGGTSTCHSNVYYIAINTSWHVSEWWRFNAQTVQV